MVVSWSMPVHPGRADARIVLRCRRRIELAARPTRDLGDHHLAL